MFAWLLLFYALSAVCSAEELFQPRGPRPVTRTTQSTSLWPEKGNGDIKGQRPVTPGQAQKPWPGYPPRATTVAPLRTTTQPKETSTSFEETLDCGQWGRYPPYYTSHLARSVLARNNLTLKYDCVLDALAFAHMKHRQYYEKMTKGMDIVVLEYEKQDYNYGVEQEIIKGAAEQWASWFKAARKSSGYRSSVCKYA